VSKAKKSKPKRRRRGFWRTIFRHYLRALHARVKGSVVRAAGPKVIATASNEWSGGEYIGLRPILRPYPWRHYVAPDDLERYVASIGSWEFVFELLPEHGKELTTAAYDAAAEHFGPYVDSQPLDWIEADNDRAALVLSHRITN
jgi:hypothetical protein